MAGQHEELIAAAMQAQRAIAHALHAAADPAWLELDLTMAQLKALMVLADDAVTVGQLANTLGIGKPAASILVERLVQLSMATRSEDALDRRRTHVHLTAEGTELVTRLRQGGQDLLRAWLGGLRDDDLAALTQGLQALAAIAADQADPIATPA